MNINNRANRKKCPKCGARVLVENDQYGWFEHCLYCGHTRDLNPAFSTSLKKAAG